MASAVVVPWRSMLHRRGRVSASSSSTEAWRVWRDGGEDAPARRQDLQVGFALQAHLELSRAVARPDGMRVRVDKTRHDHLAPGIQLFFVRVGCQQFSAVAYSSDQAVAQQQRPIGDDPQTDPALCRAAGRQPVSGVEKQEWISIMNFLYGP